MNTAPRFTNWAGALSVEGIALEAWMQARGIAIPPVPTLAGSLLTRAARFFAAYPEDTARLWQQYRIEQDKQER